MSTLPDNEFDLEKLFLPSWAQESSASKYAHYEGGEERPDRRERRGPRPPRPQGGFGGPRRDDRGGGPNRGGGDRRGSRPQGGRGRGPQEQRGPRREERPEPMPLPELNVSLVPEAKGVESLARQIRMTGRAYPLFDIAQMILQKPERHLVVFSVKKNAEGQPVQPLFVCALDDTLWLSEDEAVAHVLSKHFGTFYQSERTATEPPKGKYTFVGQCGISGIILGPPNYHDYQTRLHKLHAERFSRMPFEVYKSRVRIVRDEEVVKKWVEDQSWKTEYICLNLPEPLRLDGMEAVEKHFRETHKEIIIKPVETHTLGGVAARGLRSPQLSRLVRQVTEDQRRFPLQIATVLSQQFAGHGLQFFKVNKTITHVSVARPHFLDMDATPVSEGVKNIVKYINEHPRCTRRLLVEALAPSPAAAPAAPSAPEASAETSAAPAPAQPPANQPTPEQSAIISDLHWLIHQGHVIEFANGALETAKRPIPKPPKPAKAAPAQPKSEQTAEAPATNPEQGASPEATAPAAEVPTAEATPPPSGNEPRLITDPGTPAPPAEFVPASQPPVADPGEAPSDPTPTAPPDAPKP